MYQRCVPVLDLMVEKICKYVFQKSIVFCCNGNAKILIMTSGKSKIIQELLDEKQSTWNEVLDRNVESMTIKNWWKNKILLMKKGF